MSKCMDQSALLFLHSTTRARIAPSTRPQKHVRAARESLQGYDLSVNACIRIHHHIILFTDAVTQRHVI